MVSPTPRTKYPTKARRMLHNNVHHFPEEGSGREHSILERYHLGTETDLNNRRTTNIPACNIKRMIHELDTGEMRYEAKT